MADDVRVGIAIRATADTRALGATVRQTDRARRSIGQAAAAGTQMAGPSRAARTAPAAACLGSLVRPSGRARP